MKATETTEATLVIVLILAMAAWFWLRNRTDLDPATRLLNKL